MTEVLKKSFEGFGWSRDHGKECAHCVGEMMWASPIAGCACLSTAKSIPSH